MIPHIASRIIGFKWQEDAQAEIREEDICLDGDNWTRVLIQPWEEEELNSIRKKNPIMDVPEGRDCPCGGSNELCDMCDGTGKIRSFNNIP